jgi:hypothetical protein
MREPERANAYRQALAERAAAAIIARDQAIAERDEAIEERDFVLQLLERLGEALNRGVHFQPTPDGAELCSLYPTRADALAAMQQIRRLRAMCLASDQELATLDAAIEAARLRA